MKKFLLLILCLIPMLGKAENITNKVTILLNDEENIKIKDDKENTYVSITPNDTITIKSDEEIEGIYILYELRSEKGTIKGNNTYPLGENHFLHEFQKLDSEKEITISYENDVKIADIYVFNNGELPSFVEVWEPPCKEADLLLFSTHSDDEQLFFLGLLPTYVAKGASVQVVYFTNHYDNPKRLHEQLHGLYTVGIRNYPIIGIVPDAWSETLDSAIKNMNKSNITEEDALNFEVENIRRFKPLVIVGHDEKGEYSHGQHILNTYILKDAVIKANQEDYHPASYEKYGLWDTPKLYLHLYKENEITMNYDIPLDFFGGKTAYEVSKEGYSKHNSQQWTWFTAWINGKNNEFTKATDIKTYSPLQFGLYRSTVGEDLEKNDMFEHLTFRKDEVQNQVPEESNKNESPKKNDTIKKFNLKKLILPASLIGISIILLIIILKFKTKK